MGVSDSLSLPSVIPGGDHARSDTASHTPQYGLTFSLSRALQQRDLHKTVWRDGSKPRLDRTSFTSKPARKCLANYHRP